VAYEDIPYIALSAYCFARLSPSLCISLYHFPVEIKFSFQNASYPILVQKNRNEFISMTGDDSKILFKISDGYDLSLIDQAGKTVSLNIYIKQK
jgi:hypothetical protein